jgi:hypothetical protein
MYTLSEATGWHPSVLVTTTCENKQLIAEQQQGKDIHIF